MAMTTSASADASPHTMPRVRVVVLNWNAPGLTARCVRSLLQSTYPADRLEIVVVDNGSIDGSVPMLRASFPGLAILENGANLGFAEGCNRAMIDLEGIDAVALVNNDATVAPDWLEPLVERSLSAPDIGAVSPKLLFDTEFETVVVRAGGDGPRVELQTVVVDGIDATRRTLDGDGVVVRPDPSEPLGVHHEFADVAEFHVPVGGTDATIEVTFATDRPVEAWVRSDPGTVESTVAVAGTASVTLRAGDDRRWMVNSLGTSMTPWNEGVENHFGDPDADLDSTTVDGWSGGGVLLRRDYLDDVGRFDPTFFAYYEDTDLSWRGRRAGWRTVTEPRSRLFHLHGGSAGSTWPGFFYLNYRNWLLTTARNGSWRDVRATFAVARRLSWPYFRANVFGKLRRFRRPDTRITTRWLRVFAGFVGALPRTLGARPARTGRLLGRTPVDRPASALLPLAPPRPPSPRPGGPRLVYVDVTETLRAGWRAGIQRVVTEIVGRMITRPSDLQVVPICWSDLDGTYRQLSRREMEDFLDPRPTPNHAPPPPTDSRLRALVRPLTSRPPLRGMIDRKRRRDARRTRPPEHADLLIGTWAGPAIFLDLDATWNLRDAPRSDLLARLAAAGVRVVSLQHDILPVTRPEWFDPNLVRVFGSHLEAHLRHDHLMVCNSDHTAQQIERWAATESLDTPELRTVRLGAELPRRVDVAPVDEELLDSVAGRRLVLVVGTVEPRKNHERLIEAFDRATSSDDDTVLMIVGREGWKARGIVRRIRSHPEFGRRLLWPELVSDTTLDRLYETAAVVAVPSLDEGFGLPLAEALLHGCRVVSSDAGALREVGGEAPRYVDPTSVDDMAAAMVAALEDAASDTPAPPAVVRSWDDAAAELIDVIESLDAGPGALDAGAD